MTDFLTSTIKKTLWPFLQSEGFTAVSSRKFAREKHDVFQQLWVDAGGIAGKRSVYVILCANLPYGSVDGYLDPHGFRISNGRSWPMSTQDLAAKSMQQVVEALKASALQKLDEISTIETMLALLRRPTLEGWHSTYSALHPKWIAGDTETLAVVQANRHSLKLQ